MHNYLIYKGVQFVVWGMILKRKTIDPQQFSNSRWKLFRSA